MFKLLFVLLILATFNVHAAGVNTCADYMNPSASILLPDERNTIFNVDPAAAHMAKGIIAYAFPYAQFLCSQTAEGNQQECNSIASYLLAQAMNCITKGLTAKEIRPIATVFLRNKEFLQMILPDALGIDENQEAYQIRKRIFEQYQVIVVPGLQKNPTGLSQNFKTEDLRLLEQGYERLKAAVQNRVGANRLSQFSHIWGAGGMIARIGKKEVKGQFGEVWSDFDLQINVVVSLTEEGFSANDVAQRLAHESAHSNDHISGLALNGDHVLWSETNLAKIFSECGVRPGRETSLMNCYKKAPTWFNFHPTNYSALNSGEFYGKMMDEWVRENLGLVAMGRYRCQNPKTFIFWNEMEQQLIGEKISSPCQR